MATAALVLGILSFLCVGPVAGVPAIVLGTRARRGGVGRGMALAGIITGAVGSVVVLMGAGLYFAVVGPVLGRAREMAYRTRDAASLRQISNGLLVYATENQDRLPPSIAGAVTAGVEPRAFVSAATGHAAPTYRLPVADWRTVAGDVESHTDYVYVGQGGKADFDSTNIVAYTKDIYHGEGRNVLFGDGHVEFVRTAELGRLFAEVNKLRATRGLGALVLDGPVAAVEPAKVEPAKVAAALREALKHPEERRLAVEALALYPAPENEQALIDFLATAPGQAVDENFMRENALRQLGKFGNGQAAEAVAKNLTNSRLRGTAGQALTAMGAVAEDAVVPYLQNEDTAVQREACVVLRSIGTSKSVGALQPLAESRNAGVKRAAQGALEAIQGRRK
jgi:prepilin-type processing-associated H-X9-DG protein